jgi:hypothetical protein
MPAPTGNKNAQKWTLDKTLDTLKAIESYSYSDDCLYLGQALADAGCYDDLWAYWRRKWKREYEVISLMKMILQRFEVRIFQKMAKKEIPANVGMFALKHHYGWGKEHSESQQNKMDKAMEQEADADLNYVPKDEMQTAPSKAMETQQKAEPQKKSPASENAVQPEYIKRNNEEYTNLHTAKQVEAYGHQQQRAYKRVAEIGDGYF